MAYVASEPRLRGTAVQGGTLRIARKGGWGGLAWRTMRRKGEGMGMRGLGRVVSRCVAQDSESKLEISKETRLKLMTLGFVDEEANLAAIAKAKGDIPLAIKAQPTLTLTLTLSLTLTLTLTLILTLTPTSQGPRTKTC
ncbi:hypothetical protein AAMO2058_001186900 [Amorphochlora amoebiformis]